MNEKKSEQRVFEVFLSGFDIADIDDLCSILESGKCEGVHRFLGFEEVGNATNIRISSDDLELRRLVKQWTASTESRMHE